MAIAINTTNKLTAKTAGAGAASLTIPAFTADGVDNQVLVVGVSIGSDATVTGITWNGQALTLVGAQTNGTNCRAELWRLPIDTGYNVASDIVISLSGSARAAATAFTVSEAFKATPFDAAIGATGNTQDATVTYTNGANGDLAILVVAKRDSTEADLSAGTSTTQQGEDATADATPANNVVHFMGTEPLTSASQVVNASWTTTDREWAALVASVNWHYANYTWQGEGKAHLMGFATEMVHGSSYDIPRPALAGFSAGVLDVNGTIAATEDNRFLKT